VQESVEVALLWQCHLGGHLGYLRDDVHSSDLNHPSEHSDEGGVPRRQLWIECRSSIQLGLVVSWDWIEAFLGMLHLLSPKLVRYTL
jgi:hypothetical protein